MFYTSRPIIGPRKGVSEVMGALLLIIVVIVAVASLASFVSIAESNAQKRQSYITSVQDENLEITGAQFNEGPPGEWATANITVRNTNTAPSTLNFVKASDSWLRVWEVSGQRWANGSDIYFGSGRSGPYVMTQGFTIPARGVVQINLNFTTLTRPAANLHLLQNSSLSMVLLTAAGNFFTTVYNPPTAVEQVSISSISYQYFNRDVVSVDGSKSVSSNNTKITSYVWTVDVIKQNVTGSCASSAFANPSDFARVHFSGLTGRFSQEAFENSTTHNDSLFRLENFCFAGPFQVTLEIFDALNYTDSSQPIIIPEDTGMAPPASFTAVTNGSCTGHCFVSGVVRTVLGTIPVSSNVILVSYPGGTVSALVSPTGSYTTSNIKCSSGQITVSLNALPPQMLSCS